MKLKVRSASTPAGSFGAEAEAHGLLPSGESERYVGPFAHRVDLVDAVKDAMRVRAAAALAGFETSNLRLFRTWRYAGNVLAVAVDLGMIEAVDLTPFFRPETLATVDGAEG